MNIYICPVKDIVIIYFDKILIYSPNRTKQIIVVFADCLNNEHH